MTVSCQTWGWEWGTDDMVEAMRQLKGLGVNWIAIHPYARIRDDGTVAMSRVDGEHDWLTRPIREAHGLDLKIMIKPHLAYWGSSFDWRGQIAFKNEAHWQRFFAQYERWITRLGDVCADADAFVVGTELDRTVHREKQWRGIISALRTRYDGPLTYAANWSDYEKVPFWDALDVIAIQAYFPLMRRRGLPEPRDLETAWRALLKRLGAFSRRHDRKILFSELGYDRSELAAVRPWEGGGGSGGAIADQTQRRCLAAALRAIESDDRVVGAFLWKWFPGRTRHEDFLMSEPMVRRVIEDHWGEAP